jgi:DNA primase catalytic subunit
MHYYKNHFPADEVFEFCMLHQGDRPENREIAITNAQDMWTRYNTVLNPKELRQLILKKGPGATIHLGPHYIAAANRAHGRVIKGKQLPFDLDLTDVPFLGGFNGISKSDQHSNDRFVRLVMGQAHILKAILSEVFGYEHFLPVYSGRRGVHLWVLDASADALTSEARKAICDFIKPPKSCEDSRLFNRLEIMRHPSFKGSEVMNAIQSVFDSILTAPQSEGGIGLFDNKRDVQTFVDSLLSRPTPETASKWRHVEIECENEIRRQFRNARGSETYLRLDSFLEENATPGAFCEQNANTVLINNKPSAKNIAYKKLHSKLHDVMFTLLWPTIDTAPTVQLQHCVKIPFSEHAATRRISLPLKQLLPVSGGRALPPIVTPDDLKTSSQQLDCFLLAVAHMRSALAFARHSSPSLMDIEDIVPNSKVPARQVKKPKLQ